MNKQQSLSYKIQEEQFLDIYAIAEYAFCSRAAFYFLSGSEDGQEENIYIHRGRESHVQIDIKGKRYRNNYNELHGVYVKNYQLGIKGKVDLMRVYNKEIIPVEYKSGNYTVSDFHKLQLTLQALCIEDQFHKKIDKASVYFFRHNLHKTYTISRKDKKRAIDIIIEIKNKLKNLSIQNFKQINRPNCIHCSFYDICMPNIT